MLLIAQISRAGESKSDTVRLKLRWSHQFQFAGYYAAKEKGYYRDMGLEVEFLTSGYTEYAANCVDSGKAEFGVAGTDVLLQRAKGMQIVVLAAIFQHSAHEMVVREESGIFGPADFAGKRIMANLEHDSDFRAMLLSQRVDLANTQIISDRWDLNDFMQGKIDAISCYATTQEYALRAAGVGYRVISPATYGIDNYGECLITSERELEEHPDRVSAFRRASLKGWQYAMAHPEEIIRIILNKYPPDDPNITYEALAYEATAMRSYVLPQLVEIGTMSQERWNRIAVAYADAGMMSRNVSLAGFLYEPERPPDLRWMTRIVVGAIAGLVVLAGFLIWNMQLRREVRRRTLDLERMNADLIEENGVRRLVEGAFRESEKKLRTLIDAMPDLVLFRTKAGRWSEANAFARNLLGLRLVEHENGPSEIIAESKSPFLEAEERTLAEGTLLEQIDRSEETVLSIAGEIVVLEVIRAVVTRKDGMKSGTVILGRDVTERKRVEAALADANQALSAIITASPTAIVVIDNDRKVVEWNPAAENLFGWKRAEIFGSAVPNMGTKPSNEPVDLWDEVLHEHMITGRFIQRQRRDGATLDLFTSAAVLRNSTGATVGAVAMFVDLTDTFRAHEKLRQSLQEKEVLLKEIHHRVKNNLQVVSSLLSLQADGITDSNTKEAFRESQNRVRSMAMIHERLYRSADIAHLDFAEYVRNLTASLFASYRTKVPQTRCELDVEPVAVDIDVAIPCGLILNELISNSLKYAFPDGRSGCIHVSLQPAEGERYRLKVSDDGVGLPIDFDPRHAKTLGFQLIMLLADQLNGPIELSMEGGLGVSLSFRPRRGERENDGAGTPPTLEEHPEDPSPFRAEI